MAELPLRSSVGSRERRGVGVVGSAAASGSCHRLNSESENDKENVEHNENTISKNDDDNVDCLKLKERNTTTKERIHEDVKTARKFEHEQ